MNFIKTILLFFYGTDPASIAHHKPQAKMIAYTLGGIIAFVTVPFVFAGVSFLVSTHITPELIESVAWRWTAVLGLASVLTFSLVWLERALVIIGDAIASHWGPQLALLTIRLAMISLLSVVIAQKWEEAAHRGLIRAERQVMRDEAVAQHHQYADVEFNVSGLGSRRDQLQVSLRDTEAQLASLPAELVQAQNQVQACRLDEKRLWAEYSGMRAMDAEPSESQRNHLDQLRTRAGVKSSECKQLDRNTKERIDAYKTPLLTKLAMQRTEHGKLVADADRAIKDAADSYQGRIVEAEQALSEAGTDAMAFARVREKHPAIDRAVTSKTLLLAAIELLPLILKLLMWNSPISAETRAVLQTYSAWFRDQTRHSIDQERLRRRGGLGNAVAPPALGRAGPVRALPPSPCLVQPAAWQVNPTHVDAEWYWVGYPNS